MSGRVCSLQSGPRGPTAYRLLGPAVGTALNCCFVVSCQLRLASLCSPVFSARLSRKTQLTLQQPPPPPLLLLCLRQRHPVPHRRSSPSCR